MAATALNIEEFDTEGKFGRRPDDRTNHHGERGCCDEIRDHDFEKGRTMKNFVGIDLGTTNSAICSYDGSDTRIWKSPEQNDVTPSVIYIDRRGNRYVGKRAYDSAPHSPDNAAMLFKRLMGTSTPIELSAANLIKTPEECSSEVLKVMFGYLPEEIRNDPDTGTVITVPAAFNQMQKDATMQAANMAGIGKGRAYAGTSCRSYECHACLQY